MKMLYSFLVAALDSWISVTFVFLYCFISFYLGFYFNDMNIFSASGAVMTVFGLFSMIRFTTIEKYLNQEAIARASTGVTGPPLSTEDSKKLIKKNQVKAKVRLQHELRSEIKGLILTIIGTMIWAYGAFIPV